LWRHRVGGLLAGHGSRSGDVYRAAKPFDLRRVGRPRPHRGQQGGGRLCQDGRKQVEDAARLGAGSLGQRRAPLEDGAAGRVALRARARTPAPGRHPPANVTPERRRIEPDDVERPE
jgi:hypothetical protein